MASKRKKTNGKMSRAKVVKRSSNFQPMMVERGEESQLGFLERVLKGILR